MVGLGQRERTRPPPSSPQHGHVLPALRYATIDNVKEVLSQLKEHGCVETPRVKVPTLSKTC